MRKRWALESLHMCASVLGLARSASVEDVIKRLRHAQQSQGEKVGGWENVEGRAWARRHLGPSPLLLLLLALFAFLLALPLLLLPPPPTSHTLIQTHTQIAQTHTARAGWRLCCNADVSMLAYAGLCCPALKHAGLCYTPLQHSAERDTHATGKRKERGLEAKRKREV